MNQTRVIYYLTPQGKNPISDFLDSLSDKQQSKLSRIFQTIETYGLSYIMPHIKKLKGSPLWEIRIIGKDNVRIIYLVAYQNAIVLLHGFIKKTQKTSRKDISISMNRFNQWKLQK